jgi:hypothetical protein
MTGDLPAADQTAVKENEIKKRKEEKERSSLMSDITRDIYCRRWLATTELKT